MSNIIPLIAEKVKHEIEKNLINTMEGEGNLHSIIDSVTEMVNEIGINTIQAIITDLNLMIKESPERVGKYHVHKKGVKRSLITKFGELNFERTYYKNTKDNRFVYILDEMLEIEKYERIEGNLKGEILDKAAEVSYQKAAELSTPISLSRESVKNIIRENGAIDNLELEIKEKRKVDTIYIEADEDHVPLQNGKNKQMKLIYVYDDKTKVNKDRLKLENTRYFTGEMNPEELWTEVSTYLYEAYDLDNVKNIYIAGDGATWIKTGLEIINGSKYVLDHYHLSKYVKIITAHLPSLENPMLIDKPLWEYMRKGNKKATMGLIKDAIKETPSKTKKEKMRKAKNYISNNWEGIINLFGEEKYKCSAEGHVSHILSARLSSRPMGWSLVGADEVARMRAYKANGGSIKGYYEKLRRERRIEERIFTLDTKVLNAEKRPYNTLDPDKMISMPYLSKTQGRWLKSMLRATNF